MLLLYRIFVVVVVIGGGVFLRHRCGGVYNKMWIKSKIIGSTTSSRCFDFLLLLHHLLLVSSRLSFILFFIPTSSIHGDFSSIVFIMVVVINNNIVVIDVFFGSRSSHVNVFVAIFCSSSSCCNLRGFGGGVFIFCVTAASRLRIFK